MNRKKAERHYAEDDFGKDVRCSELKSQEKFGSAE